ncbi:MAG: M23 family metallopeptidase [Elusimicrobia bacterium]|nr:M23 family metallopeptidase [Elusimicrobiota bacterium]
MGALALLALLGPFPAAAQPAQPGLRAWERYCVLTPAGPEEPDSEMFRKLKRLVYSEHRISRGEGSVGALAALYGTTTMSLQSTNNEELLILNPGRKIMVHNKDGQLYEVRKEKETLSQIAAKHYRGRAQAQKFKESVVLANRLPGSALLGDYEFSRGDKVLLPKVIVLFDTYRFPFQGWGWGRISSRFGTRYHPVLKRLRFHDGLDIARPWGTPVYPSRSGKVVEAGWHEGYGMLIEIRHSDGATTRYGHLSKICVKPGDAVQRGRTLIGRVGSTGLSTGPHLHFEVRDRNGKPVNPGAKIGRR